MKKNETFPYLLLYFWSTILTYQTPYSLSYLGWDSDKKSHAAVFFRINSFLKMLIGLWLTCPPCDSPGNHVQRRTGQHACCEAQTHIHNNKQHSPNWHGKLYNCLFLLVLRMSTAEAIGYVLHVQNACQSVK